MRTHNNYDMTKRIPKKTADLHIRIEPELKKEFEQYLGINKKNKTDVIIGFIKAILGKA